MTTQLHSNFPEELPKEIVEVPDSRTIRADGIVRLSREFEGELDALREVAPRIGSIGVGEMRLWRVENIDFHLSQSGKQRMSVIWRGICTPTYFGGVQPPTGKPG